KEISTDLQREKIATVAECQEILTEIARDDKAENADRINVNGNYEPDNVRWATAKTQALNQRKTIFVTDLDGNEISLNAAAEKYGLSNSCIHSRYRAGYRGEKLFRPTFEPFSYDGKTLHELAKMTGLSENTIRNRYNKGWRGEELIQPVIKTKRPKAAMPSSKD
ncbi:MAG: hypothetical protein IKN27_07745, partial [Selenomonadaceae bacterium]|nr:hypothetical protein [Selenomonadaceae bacterium]